LRQASAPGNKVSLISIARRVMRERGFSPDFPPQVLVETSAAREASREGDRSIQDLRNLLWASIDNDSSRDLDQLTVAQAMPDGSVKVFVAIADVDAVVRKGSSTDDHARVNTTSVYTAAAVFPMLPEKLSTDLTSLREDQDRLAVVVELVVTAGGTVSHSNVYRALVRNHAKLAYDSVAAWLGGQAATPSAIDGCTGLAEQLRLQDQLAQLMDRYRHTHGALTLETREARPVFEGESLIDLEMDTGNRAKQLIENLMVAANTAAAEYLVNKGFPSLRRALRSPERWDAIVSLAAGLGETLPAAPDAPALERFLTACRARDPAKFADVSLAVVKLLGRGEYVIESPEQHQAHFALAVNDYSHSTAPNRRYADLVTQRLLKAAIDNAPIPYANDELSELARHCTEQGANAVKVERQVRKSAAALLLAPRVGEVFDAIVTGASQKGVWVQIAYPFIEGKLLDGAPAIEIGAHVRVKLVRTDAEHGFIDFERIAA